MAGGTIEDDDEGGRLHVVAYKVMAESAEKTGDRRQAANNFFISINTAFGAAYAFLLTSAASDKIAARAADPHALPCAAPGDHIWVVDAVAAAGIGISLLWLFTLWYYKSLSSAKFRLLGEYEVEYGVMGYQREWEIFAATSPFGKYRVSLSNIESIIAGAAVVAHFAMFFLAPHLQFPAGKG